eukprot:2574831-Prorocentrum_lima.AAC.1
MVPWPNGESRAPAFSLSASERNPKLLLDRRRSILREFELPPSGFGAKAGGASATQCVRPIAMTSIWSTGETHAE